MNQKTKIEELLERLEEFSVEELEAQKEKEVKKAKSAELRAEILRQLIYMAGGVPKRD